MTRMPDEDEPPRGTIRIGNHCTFEWACARGGDGTWIVFVDSERQCRECIDELREAVAPRLRLAVERIR